MSWSVTFIGKPDNIVSALEAESAKLEGQSKVEYDSIKPHLIGLVRENFGSSTGVQTQPLLRLEAAGHGYANGTDQVQRSATVKLESFYGQLV